jgi:hypothetical protein
MSNIHYYACPECGFENCLKITALMRIEGDLLPDGIDYEAGSDFEFDDTNDARCTECDWDGTVGELIDVEEMSAHEIRLAKLHSFIDRYEVGDLRLTHAKLKRMSKKKVIQLLDELIGEDEEVEDE